MLEIRGLTRRTLLKGAGGGVALFALAACGATPTAAPAATSAPVEEATSAPEATEAPTEVPAEAPTEAPAAPTPAQASGQATVLDWWTAWPDPDSIVRINAMLVKFNEEYPDIGVNFTPGGPGGGDFNELLLARIAAGNPPDAAVIWTPPVGFAARGSLDQIDDMMATAKYGGPDKWYPKPLATCQFRGKTYGLPFSCADYVIFYNTDWFAEKGLAVERDTLPTTFDAMRELSASFTEWDGDELKTAGFVPFAITYQYPVWSANNGSQWFSSADEKYAINSAEIVELMNYWLTWLDEEFKGDIDYLNGWGGQYEGEGSAFQLKQVPMVGGGAWSVPYVDPAKIGFQWDIAKFPVGPSGSKSMTAFWPNWFVQPAGGKHRQEAFLLNEFMCTVGMETWYRTVEDTPAWVDFPRDVMPEALVTNLGEEKARDIHNFILDYLEDTTEVWTSPIEDFGTDQINRAVDQILHKATPVQQALDDAQNITQAKLEETLQSL